jgi:hypothetical protein
MKRCSVCHHWFAPKRKDVTTCSRYCQRRRRNVRSHYRQAKTPAAQVRRQALEARIPAHHPDAPYCIVCNQRQRFGSDCLTGVSLVFCGCGTQELPLKGREHFRRYIGTEERLRYLRDRVQSAISPVESD